MAEQPKLFGPAFLSNRPVVIKISGQNALHVIVAHSDETGYWLPSEPLSRALLGGSQVVASDLQNPVVFIPMHRVEWIVTPGTR
jgi:hypothetical protein